MIEIIDKINNTIKKVKDLEIVIHPITNKILFVKDYEMPNMKIFGVIFDDQGILFCYKKLNKKVEKIENKKV